MGLPIKIKKNAGLKKIRKSKPIITNREKSG
jgi:hypothetical protein